MIFNSATNEDVIMYKLVLQNVRINRLSTKMTNTLAHGQCFVCLFVCLFVLPQFAFECGGSPEVSLQHGHHIASVSWGITVNERRFLFFLAWESMTAEPS